MIKSKVTAIIFYACFLSANAGTSVDSLKQLLLTEERDTNSVNHLNSLCRKYINVGNYDTSLYYGNIALRLSKRLNYSNGSAMAYHNIGIIFLKQCNYDKALEYNFASLKIKEKTEDKIGIASSYNNIGLTHYNQNNYSSALEYFLKALSLREAMGDKMEMALLYNNIGLLHEEQNNLSLSLKYHLESLKIKEQLGMFSELSATYSNLGNIYYKQNKVTLALKQYNKALQMDSTADDKISLAIAHGNIGSVLSEQGNFPEALKHYLWAMKLDETMNNKYVISQHLNNIASAYFHEKNYERAIYYGKKGLDIAIETKAKDNRKELYRTLADIYEQIGNFKEAYYFHKQYSSLKDSLFNDIKSKQMEEMQTKYETEKKDKEISVKQLLVEKKNQQMIAVIFIALLLIIMTGLVFWQNKLRAIQKAEEFQHRFLRLQMNPHFLFNSLSSIQNYLFNNKPDEAAIYLASFADLMRHILQSSDSEFVLMEKELEILENYMQIQQVRFNNSFYYSITTDPSIDVRFLCIPPMLVQPFIENAIQHGLSKKTADGHIHISFKVSSEKTMTIEITDNGHGITFAEQQEKKHKSMAMAITKERLDFLNKRSRRKTHFEIIDLTKTTAGAQTGTTVIFETPFMIVDELFS